MEGFRRVTNNIEIIQTLSDMSGLGLCQIIYAGIIIGWHILSKLSNRTVSYLLIETFKYSNRTFINVNLLRHY